jgi:Flp pilus assembly pilin Flp
MARERLAPSPGTQDRPFNDVRGGEMKLTNFVKTFIADEGGQDLIEYALLVALISLVCVVALTDAGTQVNNIFEQIKDKLTDAAAP